MASTSELSLRALRKIGALDAGASAPAEDFQLAQQKIRAVHASLKKEGLLRWTLADIPDYAEEPYVAMAAYLLQPEFGRPENPNWWAMGLREICSGVQIQSTGAVPADYF